MTTPVFTPAEPPETGAKKKPEVRVLVADFGDGYSQDAADGLNNVRQVWDLTWPYLNPIDADFIDDFFGYHQGWAPFLYQIPGTRTQVKWTCKEWDYSPVAGGYVTITAKFRQSFNLDD